MFFAMRVFCLFSCVFCFCLFHAEGCGGSKLASTTTVNGDVNDFNGFLTTTWQKHGSTVVWVPLPVQPSYIRGLQGLHG